MEIEKKLWANLIVQGSGLARKQSDLNSHFCYQNNTPVWIPNDDSKRETGGKGSNKRARFYGRNSISSLVVIHKHNVFVKN